MRLRRTIFVSALMMIGLLLVFLIRLERTPNSFALGMQSIGLSADGYCAFAVSLTNKSPASATIKGVQFQWIDKAGRMDSCHAFREQQVVQSKAVFTTHIAVPATARKLRVLLCGDPGPVRTKFTRLVERLPWRIQQFVFDRWSSTDDVHCPFPWIANPQGGANGRQPFGSGTNRTSATAASRRSP
jgi:hypothetical protein